MAVMLLRPAAEAIEMGLSMYGVECGTSVFEIGQRAMQFSNWGPQPRFKPLRDGAVVIGALII